MHTIRRAETGNSQEALRPHRRESTRPTAQAGPSWTGIRQQRVVDQHPARKLVVLRTFEHPACPPVDLVPELDNDLRIHLDVVPPGRVPVLRERAHEHDVAPVQRRQRNRMPLTAPGSPGSGQDEIPTRVSTTHLARILPELPDHIIIPIDDAALPVPSLVPRRIGIAIVGDIGPIRPTRSRKDSAHDPSAANAGQLPS